MRLLFAVIPRLRADPSFRAQWKRSVYGTNLLCKYGYPQDYGNGVGIVLLNFGNKRIKTDNTWAYCVAIEKLLVLPKLIWFHTKQLCAECRKLLLLIFYVYLLKIYEICTNICNL